MFAELQPEPAAAASIAQVHKAWLRCEAGPGAAVAVKVQRPGIRITVEQDLDILLRLAARLEEHARWARAIGAFGVARGFGAAIREELDFRVEARNMAAVAATWKTQQRVVGRRVPVVIPAVHEELCTEHVLVIEWLDGINLRAAGPLIEDKGLDPAALRDALLELVTRPDDIDEQQLERALGRFMARHLGALEQGRLSVGSGIVAAMLLGTSGGPKITPSLSLYQFIGYNLLIVAAILALRVLFTILRSR